MEGDAGREFFQEVAPSLQSLPGDILGFRVGRCVHHVAVVLPGPRYAHVLRGQEVVLEPELAPMFLTRLEVAWRRVP